MDKRNPVITVTVTVSPPVLGIPEKREVAFEPLDEGNAGIIRSEAARGVGEFIGQVAEGLARAKSRPR